MKYAKVLLALWFAIYTDIAAGGGFLENLRNLITGTVAQAQPAPVNPVDKVASGCLGCHNGSVTNNVNVRASGSAAPIHDFRANDDHPVGILYDASVRKNPQGYRPAATLNPNIRLVDGRVTCTTCHKLKNEVVASNETWASDQPVEPRCTASHDIPTGPGGKDFCLACHLM